MNKKKCSPREIAGEAVKWLPQIKKLRKKIGGGEGVLKGARGVKTEQLVLYNCYSV